MDKDRREKENKVHVSLKLRGDVVSRTEAYAEETNRNFSNAVETIMLLGFAQLQEQKRLAKQVEEMMKRIRELEERTKK